jgi:hypothetical protein
VSDGIVEFRCRAAEVAGRVQRQAKMSSEGKGHEHAALEGASIAGLPIASSAEPKGFAVSIVR